MNNVIGQLLFKTSLICFLGVTMWGLINELSFERVILRGAVTALAVYFTIIIYLSGIRIIIKSGVNKKKNNEETETT